MEIRLEVLWLIIGAALVTFLPRVLPLMAMTRFPLPEGLRRWLRFVPVAVMSALVAQAVLLEEGKWVPIADNIKLLAAIPAFVVAIATRNLLLTVLAGVLSLMAIRMLL